MSDCMNILILSGYTLGENVKKAEKWLRSVMNNHINYCYTNNYSYKFCTNYAHPASKVNHTPFYLGTWSKPSFILKELNEKEYDYIFWIDSDSVFVNFNFSLQDLFVYDKDLTFAGDYSDVFNGGHLLVKNTEFSREFISKWNQSRFINFADYASNVGFDLTADGYALGLHPYAA